MYICYCLIWYLYKVSGEYAMLLKGAEDGIYKLEDAVMETLIGLRRAG